VRFRLRGTFKHDATSFHNPVDREIECPPLFQQPQEHLFPAQQDEKDEQYDPALTIATWADRLTQTAPVPA
jgi:hypothetical protein